MALRHELPTHLAVEDRVLGGWSMRQVVVLLGGLSATYALWFQLSGLPQAVRTALAVAGVLVTLALALLRPAGRSVVAWTLVLLRYATRPKRCVWRPRPQVAGAGGEDTVWAPLAPSLAWAATPSAVAVAGGVP